MAGRLIVHIGLHKTGTTSIQLFCAANKAALNDAGLYYPVAGRDPDEGAHHNLYRSYSGDPNEQARFVPSRGGEAELIAEIADVSHDVLLSSEGLWVLARDEPAVFARFVRAVAGDRKPIIVVTWRNASEYGESLYFQEAKEHQMVAINRAVKWYEGFPAEFNKVLESLVERGLSDIFVLQYCRAMIERFFDFLSDNLGISGISSGSRVRHENPSLNPLQKIVAAHLSLSHQRFDRANYLAILEALNDGFIGLECSASGSIFPEDVQRKLIERSVSNLQDLLSRNKTIQIVPGLPIEDIALRPTIVSSRDAPDFAKIRQSLGYQDHKDE